MSYINNAIRWFLPKPLLVIAIGQLNLNDKSVTDEVNYHWSVTYDIAGNWPIDIF